MEKIINYILICILFIGFGVCLYTNFQSKTSLYPIEMNGKFGFIDKTGKEKIDIKYDAVIDSGEKFIAVLFNDKWGFIDRTGEFVIVPQYNYTYGFENGLAYVISDDFEGYIDYSGKYIWKKAIVKENSGNENIANKNEQESAAQAKPAKPVKNDLADDILKEFGL